MIFLGSLGGNIFLQVKIKQQLITRLDHQLQQQILQILPNSGLKADEAISHLKNLITKRRQILHLSRNFADRGYISLKFLENLDKDDIDALDQMQKLTESEFYVFKMIRDQIRFRKKVRFVDFKKK